MNAVNTHDPHESLNAATIGCEFLGTRTISLINGAMNTLTRAYDLFSTVTFFGRSWGSDARAPAMHTEFLLREIGDPY